MFVSNERMEPKGKILPNTKVLFLSYICMMAHNALRLGCTGRAVGAFNASSY